MKVIGQLKKGVSGSTIDRIKHGFNQKGIDLVLIPDYLEVQNIDQTGYEVFTYDKYLKWFLEKNYVTEESINIVRKKWEALSKGYNFVIAAGEGDNKYFYDPIQFNNMQDKNIPTEWNAATIDHKANEVNINADTIKFNGKSITRLLDDKLNEIFKPAKVEVKPIIDECVVCGDKLPRHGLSKICIKCNKRLTRRINGNTI